MKLWNRSKAASASTTSRADAAVLQTVERIQAVIHFEPDGTIKRANENFLRAFGYTKEEIIGKHHSMFVAPETVKTPEYSQFWTDLRAGKAFSNQFPRLRKDGSIIWIQGTYGPVLDEAGNVIRVVKIAIDITPRRTMIARITQALEKMANGDLSDRVPASEIADLNQLGQAFNRSADQLSKMISQVQQVVKSITDVSRQIGKDSDELSRRTETQAATLEQTAAAIEELSSNAKSATSNVTDVSREANETRHSAEGSRQVVSEVTEAMTRISTSSESISQIISVIDDIAFQTNLLALNAGVEAARAGEAGLGFAVVASEVRSLARRSAESAAEIKALIEQSSTHVNAGVTLVDRAGNELTKIFEGVGNITVRIQEVVRALNEQSTTLSEINSAISQLDQVTQRNAAMVLETAERTKGLSGDSTSLAQQVSAFHIGATGGDTEWSSGARKSHKRAG